MITEAEVAPYLRERGLLGPPASPECEPVVTVEARRNLLFKVTDRNTGLVVKQGIDSERSAAVAHEAATYQHLLADDDSAGLGRFLAGYVAYDPNRHLLVLELVPDAINLRDHHARSGRFPLVLARALGDALGTLHGVTAARHQEHEPPADPPPWVLALHQPDLAVLQHASAANVELLKVLQQAPGLGDHLDALRRDWTAAALIHNDVRWDNCIVFPKPGSHRRTRLKVVDLELAQFGDPMWDVGCVLSDYLSFWLMSIPLTGEAPPDHFIHLARFPLARMQPAIRSFWASYLRRRGFSTDVAATRLRIAMRYAAARLIQTGFEYTQSSPYLTGAVICLLQLSLNILEDPEEAVRELLGIATSPKGSLEHSS